MALIATVFTPLANAEFSSIPDAFSTYIAEDIVTTILATADALFVGGSFGSVDDIEVGAGIPFDVSGSVATPDLSFALINPQPSESGSTFEALPDGTGGWYVGGSFSQVGDETRNNVVHLLADGSVDMNFNPNTNGSVHALALSSDGSILYMGGSFTSVGGQTRHRIAAVTTVDGLVTSFDPNIHPDIPTVSGAEVYDLALSSDDAKLYFSGAFTNVNGTTRNSLAAVLTSNGSLISAFNPNPNGIPNGLILSSNDATLYLNGSFTTISGVSRRGVAAVATADGSIVTAFPDLNLDVLYSIGKSAGLALSPDGSTLYVGGSFTTIGGVSQARLAAVSTTNGAVLTGFSPQILAGTVYGIDLSSDGQTIYAGGDYAAAKVAAYNTTTGALAEPSFDVDGINNSNSVHLSEDDQALFVTGGLGFLSGTARGSIAAFYPWSGDLITSFVPETDEFGSVHAFAASPDGEVLYAAEGYGPYYIRALSRTDGQFIDALELTTNNGVYQLLVSPDGNTLYASGRFTEIDGIARNRVAAINLADHTIIQTFNPNANGDVQALALSADGLTLYLGGDFSQVGGVNRSRVAAVSTVDGSLVIGFNPGANNAVRSLVIDGTQLYVSGNFTTIAGTSRNRIAAVSTIDGSIVSGFNPNADALVRRIAMIPGTTDLAATGQFTVIGGTSRTGLAVLSTLDGTATNFNQSEPYIDAGSALFVAPDGLRIYAGNGFNTINAFAFASFSSPGVSMNNPGISVTEGGASDSYSLYLSTEPAANVTVTVTGDAQASASPSTLTFTSSNWSTPQSVSVSALSDSLTEGSHTGTITHTVASADADYNGFDLAAVTATITDGSVTPDPDDADSGSSRSSRSGQSTRIFACRDVAAINYQDSGASNPALCTYKTTVDTNFSYTRDLRFGMSGEDVSMLQKYLNSSGSVLAASGPGSPGNETTFFGVLTRSALARLQSMNSISPAVGYFGPITRAFIAEKSSTE